MVDMSQFIAAKSDQLNADDLMDSPRTITVTKVTAQPDAAEQPVSIHYEGGEGRPFKPCKTMRRVMVAVWGKDASQYVGRSMTLYRDPNVQFGGMQVGGIRISHMSDITEKKTVALLVTRGRKAPYSVLPLANAPASTSAGDEDEQAAALQALTEAASRGMEALGNVWKAKGMAPFRDALQLDLERLKSVAAAVDKGEPEQPDRPAEQPSEVNDSDPIAKTLASIADAVSLREVDAIDKDTDGGRAFLTDDQCDRLDQALAAKREELRAAQAKAKESEAAG